MSEGATPTRDPAGGARRRRARARRGPPAPADARRRGPEAPGRATSALRLLTAALLIPPLLWLIYQGGVFVLGTVIVIALLGAERVLPADRAEGRRAAARPGHGGRGGAADRDVLRLREPGDRADDGGAARDDGRAARQEPDRRGAGQHLGHLLRRLLRRLAALATRSCCASSPQVVAARWPDVAAGMDPDVGGFYLFFTISVVIAGRRRAPTSPGRAYGRRKLAPRISPGKTVEGALGAVVAGTAMAVGLKAGFDFFAPGALAPPELRRGRPDRLLAHRGRA